MNETFSYANTVLPSEFGTGFTRPASSRSATPLSWISASCTSASSKYFQLSWRSVSAVRSTAVLNAFHF
jgi:hypothetical protein